MADWNLSCYNRPLHTDSAAANAGAHAFSHNNNNIPDATSPGAETVFSDGYSQYDDLISDLTKEPQPGLSQSRESSHQSDIRDHYADDDAESTYSDNNNHNNRPTSLLAPRPMPPHVQLARLNPSLANQDYHHDADNSNSDRSVNKPLPKSPGQPSPFASLFGWGNSSPSNTEFSSIPSPLSPPKNGPANDATNNGQKINAASANPIGYCESYLSTPPPSISPSSAQIEEMEDELKAISSELAGSIRREMDLEDLVERLHEQVNNPQAPGRRTSDYFSDSGYSSTKHSEYDQNREEIEKIQRRSEQDKASLRLELTTKVQDERTRRKALDLQIKELSERASQIDLAQMNSVDATGRVKELEGTCDDLRRRLSEERQSKNNFEDLLGALRGELRDACNERDNLRDEIVPQLRARVEGLEVEAADHSSLTYESTKMQQELQSLKQENTSLRRSVILEDGPSHSSRLSGGLSRSNSVATGALRNQRPTGLGLSRSNSVKSGQIESREAIAERLKDVEAQRDALHNALKNLLDRQEFQNRENQKKIGILEGERQRLLSGSPRKAGFEKEIFSLRTEINVLRRRAEDALEQKWQVEKGLGGLKMDLDRAEAEIGSLRSLLEEKDILIPPSLARSSDSSGKLQPPATSESLHRSYSDLQAAYAESLERIKKYELGTGAGASGEKARLAMQRLERSLSAAISERDAAVQQAAGLQSQYESLSATEASSVNSERALADELTESAHQIEQLASQVRHQLAANSELRQRLTDTVSRGDLDRKHNMDRISSLQERLRVLEEEIIAAQTASEERLARHEDDISSIRDAHNEQLRRMGSSPGLSGLRSPGLKSPRMPLLTNGASALSARAPRLTPTRSLEDEAEMTLLRARVGELEKALADAEGEMQQVVAKMSAAQIEVMNLQEERETAARDTRKLQRKLEQEQVKTFEERFKTLSTTV